MSEVVNYRVRLMLLLNDMGVKYKLEPRRDGGQDLIIEDHTGPKNIGFFGFYTMFRFDSMGQLIEMGAYE